MFNLRGQVVRLAFGTAAGDLAGAFTIDIGSAPDAARPSSSCRTDDPAIREAYGIVTGLAPNALEGMQILVDANGWLRDVVPPQDAASLSAAIERIAREPLAADAGSMHHNMPM